MDTDRARLLDANGNELVLDQADMFPPIRIGAMDGEIAPDAVDKAMRFAMATMEVTLATMGLPTPVEPDRRDQIIAELRAVLAPLLDWPLTIPGEALWYCRCCGYREDRGHAPGCAVLRRDELLGR